MKLAQNVALLPAKRDGMGSLNLVLTWDDDKNLALIDAGLPGQIDEIAGLIADAGFCAEDLTHIIITHQDLDHIGCVGDLLKLAPGAKVVAHVEEAPYIDGRQTQIKVAARLEKYDTYTEEEKASIDYWKNFPPIAITDEVVDGQILPICGGIEIVHVPGHTPGHIALYLKESRIIVCGDAINIRDGQIVGSNPVHTFDMELADKSMEKIKGYDLGGAVAYHTGFLAL